MGVNLHRRTALIPIVVGVALLAAACGGGAAAPSKPVASAPEPTKPPVQTAVPTAAPTATTAPAPTAAPAAANKLILTADVVQGTKNLPPDQMAAKTCVVNSRYPRNAEILWRVRVFDPRTGDPMDDKALKSVEVRLADGKVIAAKYGKHSEDFFWTSVWLIPKDYPTGTVKHTLVATAADGRTGEFKPFDVAASLLTVTNEVLSDVVAPAKKS